MTVTSGRSHILVHDLAGHAFPIELSRDLASRGHQVDHVYCSSFPSGHGPLDPRPEDPPNLTLVPISLGAEFARYSPVTRFRHEVAYARLMLREVDRLQPEVVLESNPALLAKQLVARGLRRRAIPRAHWLQDITSEAMAQDLRQRLGPAGAVIGRIPERVESTLLRSAQAVVSITKDFDSHLTRWGVSPDRRHVIPNWAPVAAIRPKARDDRWLAEAGVDASRVVLYAGTLGLKHDPMVLADLAVALGNTDTALVVASEGLGADQLRERAEEATNLHVVGYQPFDDFTRMLSAADVTVVILNEGAGVYSVPSKVLAYLCAGRPIVASVPTGNQVTRVIDAAGAGICVPPGDDESLIRAVTGLLDDPTRAGDMGRAGRRYAEDHFDIAGIAPQFEAILVELAQSATPRVSGVAPDTSGG